MAAQAEREEQQIKNSRPGETLACGGEVMSVDLFQHMGGQSGLSVSSQLTTCVKVDLSLQPLPFLCSSGDQLHQPKHKEMITPQDTL